MTKKFKIFFSFFLLQFAVVSLSFAQVSSLSPSLIGSTGNFSQMGAAPNWYISSSVGEAVVPTFTVAAGSVRALTQGFQQPDMVGCPSAFVGFTVTPVSTICAGANITITPTMTGGVPPFTYSWSSGETTSSIVVAPTLTTAYTLTLVGCSMQNTQTITVHPVIPTPTITATPNPICAGSTLSLAASSFTVANTYVWTEPGGGTFTGLNFNISNIQSTASGTYTVIASNSTTGCSSLPGVLSVTVNAVPSPTVTAAPSLTICDGDLLTLTASGGNTYVWNNGISNALVVVTPNANISYTVDVAIGSCSVSATVSVTVNPAPVVDINGANPFFKTMCQGDGVTLASTFSATATYSWLPVAGLNIPNIYNPMASPTVSTEYTVTVTEAGCSATATASLTISTPMTFAASSNSVSCNGNCDGSASVTPSGGTAPYTYVWSSGGASSAVSNLCAQTHTVNVTDGAGCSASTTVTVGAPANLTAGTTITQPLCGCNGQATATPAGGTPPYSYSWTTTPVQTTAIAVGLCGGNQIVSVTDSKGCMTSANATLTASPGLTVTVTPPSTTICAGSTINIGAFASGSVTYAWSPGGAITNTVSVSPTTFTTYTVIVSDPISGCSDTGFISVSVNPIPSAVISGNTSICSGQSTTLTAASGGTSYSWIPANIGQTFSTGALSSNTGYTVTVTDAANCTAVGTTTVFVSPSPSASITATPSSICSGGTVTLTASGGATYFWMNNSLSVSQFTDTPTANTTYTLVAYNGSCADTTTATVTITNFNASISITNNDSTLCVGDNVTLTATAGNSYSWSTGDTTQSISITAASTNTYVVTVTTTGGCTGTDNMLVTVTSAPVATISANKDTVCLFAPVQLTAGGGGTYQWAGGPATQVYNPSPSVQGTNIYSVTVSNGNCSAGATYTVFANPLPGISASATPNQICVGDSVTLSATASGGTSPYTYGWNPGPLLGQTVIVIPSGSITYSVGAIDANGCSNFTTVPVTMNSITVNAGADITICPGFTATLNAAVTGNVTNYLWSPGQYLNDSTAQNPSANPDSTTLFIVTASSGSCLAKDSVTVYTIRTPECVIHVYNGITPNGDNDNSNWFIDGIQSYPENNVLIFNRWGSKVWSASGYNNKDVIWKGTDQQGNFLPDGTYYYLIELYDDQGATIFSESKWVEVTH